MGSGGFVNSLVAGALAVPAAFHYADHEREAVGPVPAARDHREGRGLEFGGVRPRSREIDLGLFRGLGIHEARNLILNALEPREASRLAPHLTAALRHSERNRIDPFWTLAVMRAESHFHKDAVSRANARGLMQVMPDTAVHVGRLMKKRMGRRVLQEHSKTPEGNIEFGTFYLARLLKRFKGDHKLATVAYNMGPYWVDRRLRRGLPVGERNNYLDKVERSYRRVSRTFRDYQARAGDRGAAGLALAREPQSRAPSAPRLL